MKRRPTRNRPNTPAVLRSLVRAHHRLLKIIELQTDAIDRQNEAINLLRLDVQSARISLAGLHGSITAVRNALHGPIGPIPGTQLPTLPISPWDAPCAVTQDLQDTR